jgi:hypothetical protein
MSKKKLNKWRNSPCSWTGELDGVKRSVLPNLIYRFSATSIEILANCLADTDKFVPVFIWKGSRPRIVNTILNNKVGDYSTQLQDLP